MVERLIRLTAAEFSVPVTVAYSNRLRKLKLSDKIAARSANGRDEGLSLLFPCFWEYQDFTAEQEYRERIPNTGQYDLVICILWSRLGTKISPAFVMPDGSQPTSATEYEIACGAGSDETHSGLSRIARVPESFNTRGVARAQGRTGNLFPTVGFSAGVFFNLEKQQCVFGSL